MANAQRRAAWTAREALREGASRLVARPGTLAASLLAGACAALAMRTGSAAFSRSIGLGHLGAGLFLFLLAASVAAVLIGSALAAVLAEDDAAVIAPSRGVAIVSLWAIERVVVGALALGALAPALRLAERHTHASPAALALGVALSVTPPLFFALIAALSFRIAVARTAAGLSSVDALAEGVAAALTQLGPVLRLLSLGVVFTAPLWLLQLALGRLIAASHNAPVIVLAEAARGAAALLAAAWVYAALSTLLSEPATAPVATTAPTVAPPAPDPDPSPPPPDSLPA